jgi:cytochrome c556
MRIKTLMALVIFGMNVSSITHAQDDRELVELAPMMREHMLGNMRDHLKALDEIFLALSLGKTSEAAKTAESRLGMSSMGLHGASHMAPFMPEQMQSFGTAMHQAASRFSKAIELSDISPSEENQRNIYAAFQEITANCTACHQAYRIH